MSLIAPFEDGKFVTSNASTNSIAKSKETNSSGIDSEAFLQLLVAEMQNQDPLEPTTNTEWISQYATFTQVSEIQSIGDSMTNMSAQSLTGQYVIMKVTDDTGNTDFVSGKVDYVVFEEGKAYLSINDKRYSIDDLDTVASPEYMEAYELASSIVDAIKKLPALDKLTTDFKSTVEDIVEKTSNMNSYQRGFLDSSVFELIENYDAKMKQLTAASKVNETAKSDNTKSDDESKKNESSKTDSTTKTDDAADKGKDVVSNPADASESDKTAEDVIEDAEKTAEQIAAALTEDKE